MRNGFTVAGRMRPVRGRGRSASQRIGVRSLYGSRAGTGVASATFCAAVVIAVTFAAQVNSVTRAQSSTGAIWEGEIEYVQRISIGDSAGQFRNTWTMSARWVESGRIDVTANDGVVTGQVVVLRDEGSSWNASASGVVRSPGMTITNRGNGAGSSVINSGIVYRSLVDDDPLADVLPNGAYAFMGDSTQTFQLTATVVTIDPPATRSQRTESPPPLFMVSAFANAPLNPDLQRLPANQLRQALASIASAAGLAQV